MMACDQNTGEKARLREAPSAATQRAGHRSGASKHRQTMRKTNPQAKAAERADIRLKRWATSPQGRRVKSLPTST
jgi:hypothetical protein